MRQFRSIFVLASLLLLMGELVGCGSPNSGSSPPAPGTGQKGVGGTAGNGSGNVSAGGPAFNAGIGGISTACTNVNGTAPPGCGDGIVQTNLGEQCDDGNTLAGDGCSGTCQIEPNHTCPPTGGPCVVSFKCGDGVVNPGEACDEGQYQGEPGCSADCKTQTPGYNCIPGQACVPLFVCGNGRIEQGETCDPPNPGNGCSATCQTEAGWRCVPGSCSRLPYCGDGIVQASLGEKCDEGQYQGQPGCSADCKTQDSSCTCTPGQACVCQKPVCGDGIIEIGEQCDDKNSPYPGCSATCQIESGYQCPFAGAPCVPVCGDGILITPAEQCDPGIAAEAQACNSDCTVKSGWACNATGCHQTVCGDGVVEGTEGCDPLPKNNDLGDGCTPLCTAEPNCPAGGGPCTTKCGDGLVLGTEQCDDGNAVSGDGCSSTCQVEPGYQCSVPPLGNTMVVPMVVRDFNAGGDFEKGSAFATGLNYANQNLLQTTLDAKGLKPVLVSTTGTYNGAAGQDSGIASPASYAQWYNDAAPASADTYRGTIPTTLTLYLNSYLNQTGLTPASVAYVNRYGPNGEQYVIMSQPGQHWCGTVGQEDHDANGNPIPCTFCPYDSNPATPQCDPAPQATDCQTIPNMYQCVKNGNSWSGIWITAAFDGNPLWFPADAFPQPWSPNSQATVSGNYDPSWPVQKDAAGNPIMHNFSFTTEVRFWFEYDATQPYNLTFVGDDDVWVFINKKLAVDLGGIHTAVQGVLKFGSTGAATTTVTPTNVTSATPITANPNLGLQSGNVYEIAVFQAERQTTGSSYQLSLSGFDAAHSVCKPVCGGTNPAVSPGQQCNNGDAGNCAVSVTNDCYNQCTTSCTLGPYCGDGIVQTADGEQCDNGKNVDGYAATGSDACAPGCKLPPNCGDGKVQLEYGEQCDNGPANCDPSSASCYGVCTTSCTLGPYCGDGIVNGDASHPEACDDGINDGTYNTCGVGCTLPPRCGDGIVQANWGEQCEPTSSNDPNCTQDCKLPGYCGDGVVQTQLGEQCDYGTAQNTGAYGGCNSNCTLAPYCGDGVKNGPEQCDLGAALNTGAYGGCEPTCLLGPHCGDGIVNGPEQCDDGTGTSGSGSDAGAGIGTNACGSTSGNGSATSHCTTECTKYVGGAS